MRVFEKAECKRKILLRERETERLHMHILKAGKVIEYYTHLPSKMYRADGVDGPPEMERS